MANKISEEQLKKLQEQVAKLNAIKHDLGALRLQQHNLEHAAVEVMKEQEETKAELEGQFGKISVNLQDGTFEPIEEEAEVVE
jgi:predicted  nucleic acid-binding Zn-ribbon protein